LACERIKPSFKMTSYNLKCFGTFLVFLLLSPTTLSTSSDLLKYSIRNSEASAHNIHEISTFTDEKEVKQLGREENNTESEKRASALKEALLKRFYYIFGHAPVKGKIRRQARRLYQPRIKATPFDPLDVETELDRNLEENYYNADDDDSSNVNNIYNEQCTTYLFSFLEGTTDAHDTCEGIRNAYSAAGCETDHDEYNQKNDLDDYFTEFSEHQCCQALMVHYSDYCEEGGMLSNFHLLVGACVLLLCELAKAAVNKAGLKFFPEAGICILVGTVCGLIAQLFYQILPGDFKLSDMSFDDELFLAVLLPPIIFEAALSVSKLEFKRRRGAIFMFSVFGTVISTFSSGLMVHYLSKASNSYTIPMLDSLVFGALISSIDPVAILSVLTSLNLDQKDTIFILIFGESLLNDGIAITVFQTLVNRFDGKTNDGSTSVDEVLDALATFLIAMLGSITIGIACGIGAWLYFNLLENHLPPVMEVGSFFLWALIPYYICDGVGWSGIVSIVAVGFFMDIYIAGPKRKMTPTESSFENSLESSGHYLNMAPTDEDFSLAVASTEGGRSLASVRPILSTERIHLSSVANRHIRFVAHLIAQLSENAIFAYLGLFLFNGNYDWDPMLMTIGVASCVLSRALMVVIVSRVIYLVYKCRKKTGNHSNSSRTASAIREPRTQAVLVLAGLRGAVSLALVENVPIYNATTGEGCEFKQVLKGMVSACILFTTFVFGGGAYYILPHLGITPELHNNGSSTATPSFGTKKKSNLTLSNAVAC